MQNNRFIEGSSRLGLKPVNGLAAPNVYPQRDIPFRTRTGIRSTDASLFFTAAEAPRRASYRHRRAMSGALA
jgi:hypothetical protein